MISGGIFKSSTIIKECITEKKNLIGITKGIVTKKLLERAELLERIR